MNKPELLGRWTKEKSEDTYGIKNWGGAGYYSISDQGEVLINPYKDQQSAVSLKEIIEGVKDSGLDMPVLLRFENLIDARISYINESFRHSIETLGYKGGAYRGGVYPVKVNQQQQVIEEVTKYGKKISSWT